MKNTKLNPTSIYPFNQNSFISDENGKGQNYPNDETKKNPNLIKNILSTNHNKSFEESNNEINDENYSFIQSNQMEETSERIDYSNTLRSKYDDLDDSKLLWLMKAGIYFDENYEVTFEKGILDIKNYLEELKPDEIQEKFEIFEEFISKKEIFEKWLKGSRSHSLLSNKI